MNLPEYNYSSWFKQTWNDLIKKDYPKCFNCGTKMKRTSNQSFNTSRCWHVTKCPYLTSIWQDSDIPEYTIYQCGDKESKVIEVLHMTKYNSEVDGLKLQYAENGGYRYMDYPTSREQFDTIRNKYQKLKCYQ